MHKFEFDGPLQSSSGSVPAPTSSGSLSHAVVPSRGQLLDSHPLRPQETDDVPNCLCIRPWGKNLVVCIDGTANTYNRYSTNVVELYGLLENSSVQSVHYIPGIGTEGSGWKRTLDKALAKTFKEKILDAYEWLIANCDDNDRIFLFGFSRGAYQVRVLSGLIEKVGLLRERHRENMQSAYRLYKTEAKRSASGQTIGNVNDQCAAFKRSLSRPGVRTHFVGVWDTVSSIGLIRGPGFPNAVDGMKHVCVFRHALALDEVRVKFQPEFVNGGQGPSGSDPHERQHTKEVWFAGSHSDIGGLKARGADLSSFGPSLRWMRYEAIANGLRMNTVRTNWTSAKPTTSMTLGWKAMELLPVKHLSYKDQSTTMRRPHLQAPRQIQPHQFIHDSVFENYISNSDYRYKPKALTASGNWGNKNSFKRIELDKYKDVGDLLRGMEDYARGTRLSPQDLDRLISIKNHPDIGRFTILEHSKFAVLLFESLFFEFAEWRSRLGRDFNPDDRLDATWSQHLSKLVDIILVFTELPANSLNVSETLVRELCFHLERIDPQRKQEFDKFKQLPLTLDLISNAKDVESQWRIDEIVSQSRRAGKQRQTSELRF